jgi:hypothetical protein
MESKKPNDLEPEPSDQEPVEQEPVEQYQDGGSCGCLLSKDYLCGTNCSNKYYRKYLKYKNKYLNLRGGNPPPLPEKKMISLTKGKDITCPTVKCPNSQNPCCSAEMYESGNNAVLCSICGILHPKKQDKYKPPCASVKKVFSQFNAPSQKDKDIEKYMLKKKTLEGNCS